MPVNQPSTSAAAQPARKRMRSLTGGLGAIALLTAAITAPAPVSAAPTRLGFSAISCAPWHASIQRDNYFQVAGRVKFNRDATGRILLFCPVFDTDLIGGDATSFSITYLDPDGAGDQTRVRAALRYVDVAGRVRTLASIDSNAEGHQDFGEARTLINEGFDFSERHHFVQMTLDRSSLSANPEIAGFNICSTIL